MTTPKAPYI